MMIVSFKVINIIINIMPNLTLLLKRAVVIMIHNGFHHCKLPLTLTSTVLPIATKKGRCHYASPLCININFISISNSITKKGRCHYASLHIDWQLAWPGFMDILWRCRHCQHHHHNYHHHRHLHHHYTFAWSHGMDTCDLNSKSDQISHDNQQFLRVNNLNTKEIWRLSSVQQFEWVLEWRSSWFEV